MNGAGRRPSVPLTWRHVVLVAVLCTMVGVCVGACAWGAVQLWA